VGWQVGLEASQPRLRAGNGSP